MSLLQQPTSPNGTPKLHMLCHNKTWPDAFMLCLHRANAGLKITVFERHRSLGAFSESGAGNNPQQQLQKIRNHDHDDGNDDGTTNNNTEEAEGKNERMELSQTPMQSPAVSSSVCLKRYVGTVITVDRGVVLLRFSYISGQVCVDVNKGLVNHTRYLPCNPNKILEVCLGDVSVSQVSSILQHCHHTNHIHFVEKWGSSANPIVEYTQPETLGVKASDHHPTKPVDGLAKVTKATGENKMNAVSLKDAPQQTKEDFDAQRKQHQAAYNHMLSVLFTKYVDGYEVQKKKQQAGAVKNERKEENAMSESAALVKIEEGVPQASERQSRSVEEQIKVTHESIPLFSLGEQPDHDSSDEEDSFDGIRTTEPLLLQQHLKTERGQKKSEKCEDGPPKRKVHRIEIPTYRPPLAEEYRQTIRTFPFSATGFQYHEFRRLHEQKEEALCRNKFQEKEEEPTGRYRAIETLNKTLNQELQEFDVLRPQPALARDQLSSLLPYRSRNHWLQRYRNSCKLGEGTFGDVYVAFDMCAQHFVVVKRLKKGTHNDGMIHTTIVREAMIMKTRRHKNILPLLDVCFGREDIRFIFPYISHDFAGLLRGKGFPHSNGATYFDLPSALATSRIRSVVRQLLDALQYLHRCGVIHRDVKTSNLLVHSTGRLLLADFGWSRFYPILPSQGHTSQSQPATTTIAPLLPLHRHASIFDENDTTEKVVDTGLTCPPCALNYRPMELLMGGTYYDQDLDIFGAGCCMFEMFTGGDLLFPGKTEMEVLKSQVRMHGVPSEKIQQQFFCSHNAAHSNRSLKPPPITLKELNIFAAAQESTNRAARPASTATASKSKSHHRDEAPVEEPKGIFFQTCESRRIPKEAAELIWNMTNTNPLKRPSADKALAHKFLAPGDCATEAELRDALPKKCMHYFVLNRRSSGAR